jgi:hypothetical protein
MVKLSVDDKLELCLQSGVYAHLEVHYITHLLEPFEFLRLRIAVIVLLLPLGARREAGRPLLIVRGVLSREHLLYLNCF